MKFLFDLDGTVTSVETLPLIATHFGIEDKISSLTQQTVQGNVPFVESFIKRVNILGEYPVNQISDLLAKAELHPLVHSFIMSHKQHCVVVTGNLDCWCDKLIQNVGCQGYCSTAQTESNKVIKIEKLLRKEAIVEQYQALGETVVFIGDGNNDLEAMRHANISIAAGLTHSPANSLLAIADYVIYNEKALCRQLNQLLSVAQA